MCCVCKRVGWGKKTRKKKGERKEVENTGTKPGAVGVFVTRDRVLPPTSAGSEYVPTRLLRSSNNAKRPSTGGDWRPSVLLSQPVLRSAQWITNTWLQSPHPIARMYRTYHMPSV